MICERCGTVFCVDTQEDSFYLSGGRVLYCSKLCKRKAQPNWRKLRHKGGNPRKIRNQVAYMRRRDGDNCHLCGQPIDFTITDVNDPMRYSRDHVVPRVLGGGGTVANMRLAHRQCNTERGQELLIAEGTPCER